MKKRSIVPSKVVILLILILLIASAALVMDVDQIGLVRRRGGSVLQSISV